MNADGVHFRVWSLSCLLAHHQLHPKNPGWDSSVNNVSAKGSHGSSGTGKKHMKILNHLSAILARGRGENPDSVVAVFAPELSSGDNHLTVVESVRHMDTDDAGEMQAPAEDSSLPSSGSSSPLEPSSFFVTRNSNNKIQDGRDTVIISAKADISMVEMLYKDVDAKRGGFPKYVEACLHGLRLCAQLKRRGDRELDYQHRRALFEFIVRQSRTKISRKRTAIWKYYFIPTGAGPKDPPPPPGLRAWNPLTDSDDIEFVFRPTPQIDVIISKVPRFSSVRRQRTDGQSGFEYPIQGTTILAFTDALARVMQHMETALKSSDFADICKCLIAIYGLLKAFPKQFWENKSLQKLLEDIHRYKALVSPNEVRELEDESVTLDSDLDSHIADFPEPCRRFLRTFASLTVTYFATELLVKRTIFRSEVPFTVHMISLIPSVLEQLDVSTEVTKVIRMWEAAELIEKDVISQLDVGALKTMGGACHCEAIIMASIYPGAATNAPREIRDVFTSANMSASTEHCIGVSKKCCPLCYALGKILREEHNLDISLPGSHSLYSAWIPPTWLPTTVLLQLETVLVESLVRMFVTPVPKSTATSPASSDSEDDLLVGPKGLPDTDLEGL